MWEAKRNKHEFDEQKIKRDGILGEQYRFASTRVLPTPTLFF